MSKLIESCSDSLKLPEYRPLFFMASDGLYFLNKGDKGLGSVVVADPFEDVADENSTKDMRGGWIARLLHRLLPKRSH